MKKLLKKPFSYILYASILCFFTGCEKYYLSLTDQKINVNSLASTHANTPDKRQHSPPIGEMIVMDWRVPKEILDKKPIIDLYVIYGNYTEQRFEYPIFKRMGYKTCKVLNDDFVSSKGVITYRADLRLNDGQIYRSWDHQLWVNLITIDDDEPIDLEEAVVELDSVENLIDQSRGDAGEFSVRGQD
ncbi:MAG: hypothetical protein NTZ52_05545 [Chlamydiae bacterium]|nr:hypothetical protein [Chlamydiota bacterium]